jgi:DNA-binding beta-propeller fold protein YncE
VLRVSTTTGAVTTFASLGLADPMGLAFDGAGNLWVSTYNGLRLVRIAADGSFFDLPGGFIADNATNGVAVVTCPPCTSTSRQGRATGRGPCPPSTASTRARR